MRERGGGPTSSGAQTPYRIDHSNEIRAHFAPRREPAHPARPARALFGRDRDKLCSVILRALVPLLLLASTATAPFQCAKTHDPNLRMEEDPSQVLYELAEAFHKKGDAPARAETLRFLIAKYPSSRYAEMARQDLSEPAAR